MNTITITFIHAEAIPPKYKFGDRVAIAGDCQPEAWATGKVVGLHLDEYKFSPTTWSYVCKLDKPLGYTEDYEENDLVPESEIPNLQAKWDEGEAAWGRENQESAVSAKERHP